MQENLPRTRRPARSRSALWNPRAARSLLGKANQNTTRKANYRVFMTGVFQRVQNLCSLLPPSVIICEILRERKKDTCRGWWGETKQKPHQQKCSFAPGPSSQSHIGYSWVVVFLFGWLFFFLLCPPAAFKAGGKHLCNLETFKLDGGRVFHHSSSPTPHFCRTPDKWTLEKAARLMETLRVENQNKGNTEDYTLSFTERWFSALPHTIFKNKLNKTDLGIAARRVCVSWPLQAPAYWVQRLSFRFSHENKGKMFFPVLSAGPKLRRK